MTVGLLIGAVVGLLVGLAAGAVLQAGRRARLQGEASATAARLDEARRAEADARSTADALRAELTAEQQARARAEGEVEHLVRSAAEREALREEDDRRLVAAFSDASRQALAENRDQFLELAGARLTHARAEAAADLSQRQQAIEQLLAPMGATLARYEAGLRQLELERQDAYSTLRQQVGALHRSQEQLERQTGSLVTALRSPQTRGRWGEVQLRRVVELAGMVAHCDFVEQVSVDGPEGRLRPDMVVRLPGGGEVVVDAKVPLDAYLSAVDAEDEATQRQHLAAHARQLRTHVDQLARKQYAGHFERSPEFVVAFVPGDTLVGAAFEQDPGLAEHAMAKGVLVVTPTTLIALLRTVAFSWRQEDLAANAQEVQRLGAELYERLRVLGGHLAKVQRNLAGTVESFNQAVGSLESRVMVTARRFPSLGVGVAGGELPVLDPVLTTPRLVRSAEPDPELETPGHPAGGALAQADPVIRRLPGPA